MTYENFGKCLAIFEIFWKTLEMVQNGFKISGKSLEIFGKLQKRFKSVFQMILWFLNIFEKSLEVFRFSENF